MECNAQTMAILFLGYAALHALYAVCFWDVLLLRDRVDNRGMGRVGMATDWFIPSFLVESVTFKASISMDILYANNRRRFSLNKARRPLLRIASPCVYRDGPYFSVSFGNISQYDTPFYLLLLSFRQSRCSDGAGLYAEFYGLTFDDIVRLLMYFPQYAFYYSADCVEVEQAVKARAVNFEIMDACCMH